MVKKAFLGVLTLCFTIALSIGTNSVKAEEGGGKIFFHIIDNRGDCAGCVTDGGICHGDDGTVDCF